MGRNLAMSQAQCRLDQAGNSGRRLQVANVGFDRADKAAVTAGPADGQRRRQRVGLDGIADRSAGSVCLDVLQLARLNACLAARFVDQGLLRGAAWHGNARSAAVLIDCRAADERVDWVAVGERPVERLEDHHPRALPAHVAVGARVESSGPAIRRQHSGLGLRDGVVRLEHGIDAAGQGHARFPAPDALAGQVSGDQ